MFANDYFESLNTVLSSVYQDQLENIRLAGEWMAQTIEKDGLIHVFGCGHSHMVAEELFYRAGGLLAINPIFESSVMLHEGARKSSQIERMSGYAQLVLEQYDVEAHDTFIVSSSSGINPFSIEMAENAKKVGAKVIAITSLNYMDTVSRDVRGYHLKDMCDLCINNHVPCGDATVQVTESGVKAGPVSTISSLLIANAMMLSACEVLQEKGISPLVYMSGNIPGGDDYNAKMNKQYSRRIKRL